MTTWILLYWLSAGDGTPPKMGLYPAAFHSQELCERSGNGLHLFGPYFQIGLRNEVAIVEGQEGTAYNVVAWACVPGAYYIGGGG